MDLRVIEKVNLRLNSLYRIKQSLNAPLYRLLVICFFYLSLIMLVFHHTQIQQIIYACFVLSLPCCSRLIINIDFKINVEQICLVALIFGITLNILFMAQYN